jgi:FMN-dependent NADH-azoreductase
MSAKLVKEIKDRIKEEGPIAEVVELSLEELHIPAISNDIRKILEKAVNL